MSARATHTKKPSTAIAYTKRNDKKKLQYKCNCGNKEFSTSNKGQWNKHQQSKRHREAYGLAVITRDNLVKEKLKKLKKELGEKEFNKQINNLLLERMEDPETSHFLQENSKPTFHIDPLYFVTQDSIKRQQNSYTDEHSNNHNAKASSQNETNQNTTTTTSLNKVPPRIDMGDVCLTPNTDFAQPDHWNRPEDTYLYPLQTHDETFELDKTSTEYLDIKTKFNSTCEKEIIRVERVQNKWLWWKFHSNRAQMAAKAWFMLPTNERESNKNASSLSNEYYLFHGTENSVIQDIKKQGIDFRLTKRCVLGRAAYFTQNAELAHRYSKQKSEEAEKKLVIEKSDYFCVVLCRVILGNYIKLEGNCPNGGSISRPPVSNIYTGELYDAIYSDKNAVKIKDADQYAVFDNRQIYPEYIVYYKR